MENNWVYCSVLFILFFLENDLFTENGKKVACTSHLPSFPFPIHPSYIHTAALTFQGHVRNIFKLYMEHFF